MTDRLPRVLSYPPVHDYVDRLHGSVGDLVHRDQPWPRLPDLYDPDWVASHSSDWDVAHFHFTWEQYEPGTLAAVLDAHRSAGTPVVWTAHDLRNPHLPDSAGRDDVYLGLLAQSATEVLTLTNGAAQEIQDRFGRRAQVVPHGPLVDAATASQLRDGRRGSPAPLRVLLLAKSLRSNLDWHAPLEAVRHFHTYVDAGIVGTTEIELDIHLHPDASRRAELEALDRVPGITVSVAPRLSTPALWRRVAAADVLLLPYLWGTHSGLLELATDLGVQVIASDIGYLHQQAPCHLVPVRRGRVAADRLRDVLRCLVDGQQMTEPVAVEERQRLLGTLRSSHARLYGRLRSSRGTAVGR